VAGGKAEGDNRPVLRPDNVVTLPGGVQALYEVEQEADLSLLWRVLERGRETMRWNVTTILHRDAGGDSGVFAVSRV